MRKEYIKPAIQCVDIECESMLCSSDVTGTSVFEDYADPTQSSLSKKRGYSVWDYEEE